MITKRVVAQTRCTDQNRPHRAFANVMASAPRPLRVASIERYRASQANAISVLQSARISARINERTAESFNEFSIRSIITHQELKLSNRVVSLVVRSEPEAIL